ncbi:retinal degeneration B-PD [Capsaspora owczarzaki ATCC 30864]|uniref:Retinal degeneration B-PD n=1 Tax=Capsaspora owczarzaki (strain ATCC 30864) TaxID=595528 RepID=A0A0D2WVL1_CAPO3|nr:retinal degeneration B-PD [Capsaspora owczarzaki ATCC 30864]KJE96268.1 retinal degeneration B-PD [Capsaspora owczarzaki ATCC 30864]|eukprot:XP_004344236.2 retinal degeneration B-PD [Capsaspora owczarzaki ATCC 30864]
MLIKEYRIPLPLTVEQYRIGQLYMIAKKSREESEGEGSGIEILVNEPYENGPGGKGQFTRKIYHVGRHLPSWIKAVLPKSAFILYEEAWNAYPYTRTKYQCPLVDKFVLDIETRFYNDDGSQDNVFGLSNSELKERTVDFIDIVNDKVEKDYKPEEDPGLYVSKVTQRGPLKSDWVKTATPLMCAYKVCRVEFRYWGLQSKIERFVHQAAIRNVLLRAHRQVWCWQDEWWTMSMEDIRAMERETQAALAQVMTKRLEDGAEAGESEEAGEAGAHPASAASAANQQAQLALPAASSSSATSATATLTPASPAGALPVSALDVESSQLSMLHRVSVSTAGSYASLSQGSDSNDEDEFFDAADSFETLQVENAVHAHMQAMPRSAATSSAGSHAAATPQHLVLVVAPHMLIEESNELDDVHNEFDTFVHTLHAVVHTHYKDDQGAIALRKIRCQPVGSEAQSLLESIDPSSDGSEYARAAVLALFTVSSAQFVQRVSDLGREAARVYKEFKASHPSFNGTVSMVGDSVGGLLALELLSQRIIPEQQAPVTVESSRPSTSNASSAPSSMNYISAFVEPAIMLPFQVTNLFTFSSPISLVLAFRNQAKGERSMPRPACQQLYNLYQSVDPTAFRIEPLLDARFKSVPHMTVPRFHAYPCGTGAPPSLSNSVREHKELFGSSKAAATSAGLATHLLASHSSGHLNSAVLDALAQQWWGERRVDYEVYFPKGIESFPRSALMHILHSSYWESKDVAAFIVREVLGRASYLPPAVNQPVTRLSMRQSSQGSQRKGLVLDSPGPHSPGSVSSTVPSVEDDDDSDDGGSQPGSARGSDASLGDRPKWRRKRTWFKVKGRVPNHRAPDVVALDAHDVHQTLSAKFMYGSFDLNALTGEDVDVFIMSDPLNNEWCYLDTVRTSKTGTITYVLPEERKMGVGVYPVRMIVRGDASLAECNLFIVQKHTRAVVCSVDGAFAASTTISGADPRIQPGATDAVRFWADRGFLIMYVSARPDIQLHGVVAWMARHNFPLGVISLRDSLSKDPAKQKIKYLRALRDATALEYFACYGSSKDVAVYAALDIEPSRTFVIGSKQPKEGCVVMMDGYSDHLTMVKDQALADLAIRPVSQIGQPSVVTRKHIFLHQSPSEEEASTQLLTATGSGTFSDPGGSGNVSPAPTGDPSEPRRKSIIMRKMGTWRISRAGSYDGSEEESGNHPTATKLSH